VSTGERIKEIKEQLRAVPKSGIGYGILRYLNQTLNPGAEPEISFNYRGQSDDSFSVGEVRSREGKRRDKVEVGASVINGHLQVSWTFNRQQVDEVEMERVAEWNMEELREIIRHCAEPAAGGYTPSDFPLANLSDQQLNQLLAEVEFQV
jgi:microcystin synthetase protein McyA